MEAYAPLVHPSRRAPSARSSGMRARVVWLRRLDAVQAVRRVLAGEEQHVGVGRRLARMDGVRRNVDDRAGLCLDLLAAHLGPERAFENVDPLLVGMRMRLGA